MSRPQRVSTFVHELRHAGSAEPPAHDTLAAKHVKPTRASRQRDGRALGYEESPRAIAVWSVCSDTIPAVSGTVGHSASVEEEAGKQPDAGHDILLKERLKGVEGEERRASGRRARLAF